MSILYSLFITILFSCDNRPNDKTLAEQDITVEEATDFNDYFTRYGEGWTGGDVGFTIPLSDGRIVWAFGDSFLGTVNPDRTRSRQSFVNNTFMVQDGKKFITLAGEGPSALLKPENPEEKYWPQDGFVNGDKLYVFLYTWKANPRGGVFGMDFVRTDLAIFDLPEIRLREIKKLQEEELIWGAGIMQDGNYIYNYGSKDFHGMNQANVSRIPIDNVEGPWEYFSASGWSSKNNNNKIILEGNSNQFTVFKHRGHYYLFTQEAMDLSNKVYRYKADRPEGPFTDKKLVYQTPHHGAGTWTYMAKAHPEFMNKDGALLISYNVNSFDLDKLFENADLYRLHFVRAKNWE